MIRKIIVFILWCFSCHALPASTPETADSLFEAANALYTKKQYAEAASAYRAVEERGFVSAALYFNLGNSHFRQQNIGWAIFCYEKGKRLDPYDEDLSYNLEHARLFLKDQIVPAPRLFLTAYPVQFVDWLQVDYLTIAATAFWFVLVGFLSFEKSRSEWMEPSWWSNAKKAIVATFTVVIFFWAAKEYRLWTLEEGIILGKVVDVKNEPDPNGPTAFLLHEGTKVDYMETVETWIKIRLPDGKVGWIPATEVGML